jgi:hypothetical protein
MRDLSKKPRQRLPSAWMLVLAYCAASYRERGESFVKHKCTVISIVMAALVLVSLFAAISSAASVSGQTMTGTGPAVTSSAAMGQSSPYPSGFSGWADYYAVDTSGTLWHTDGSGTWDSLGGACTASPAAVSWHSSSFRQDVFVTGTDGAVWWKYYDNGWSNWIGLGGKLASGTGPAVSSWSAGRLDVFAEGTNGALYHKWWNGAKWSGWESLGGKLTASPAAVSEIGTQNAHNIYVYVRGTDGAVWQRNWNGAAWSSWRSLGGKLAPNTGPAVSLDLWLIVQGTDNQLWQRGGSVGGINWESLGVAPPEALSTSSPGATCIPANDHTLVCFSSTSGNVWTGTHDVTGLISSWSSVGSPP